MASSKPHVVVFPFMAQGHIIPFIDLSKALSRRGLKVTIVTTPLNAASVKPRISSQHCSEIIRLVTIPFPAGGCGCENASQTLSPEHALALMNASKLLREPFEAALKAMMTAGEKDEAPACVISDSFLGWTNALCRGLGIPRLVFSGMGVFAMAVKKSLSVDLKALESISSKLDDDGDKVDVKLETKPSFDITRGDLPRSLRVTDCGISQFYLEAERSDLGSRAVIANSFAELENNYVPSLEALYGNETRAFCVGPLFLYDQIGEGNSEIGPIGPNTEWAEWLDLRGRERERSVIYVSFGSEANLSDEQLDEVAQGLESSGEEYIWVVRSKGWRNPTVAAGAAKGLVVREWVDQKWALGHVAVGGFMSHCGWNSVVEGLGNGVPILAWPMQAEQHLNGKYLVREVGAGVEMPGGWARDGRVVGRREIREGVRELMRGAGGERAREKAAEWKIKARRAVGAAGSSSDSLDEFVELIRDENKKKKKSNNM